MIDKKPVVCCGCAQACGVLVQVDDNRVVTITGDSTHPVSAGYICPKGTHATDLMYHPDRVHQPLRRAGRRGGGQWDPIPWGQALDEIATRIREITQEHGRESLACAFGTLHSADWGLGERFMNLFGSPNSVGQDKICYGPTAVGESLTYGFGPSVFTYPVAGITRCVVLWGMRPSASSPLLWIAIRAARKAGAKLIVVDPQYTREARAADLWLQIRPGTDTALALGLIDAIIRSGTYDTAFVERFTLGFDELAERARACDPATVASLTDLDAGSVAQAADMITANPPVVFNAGNGLCQAGIMAVQNGRAIACLVALTGNLNVPGGHALAGPPRDIIANGAAVAVDALPASQRAKRLGGGLLPFVGAGYDDLDRPMSQAWYGQRHLLSWIATAWQPALWRAIIERDPYPVKALILQHHNPVGAGANIGRAAAALAHPNLELLVAHDLFLNASSRLADYVLPAAHWLEVPYFSVGYGYLGFVGDYAAASHAALSPTHEHHSDYALWRDLGRRLGQAEAWLERAEDFWNTCLEPAGLRFDDVAAHAGPLVGEAARNAAHDARARDPARFGTPSGKVELSSNVLKTWRIDPVPGFRLPAIFGQAGADYPLVLTTGGRAIEGLHQNAQQMHAYRRKYPQPEVSLHPSTASKLAIEDGDWVYIETPIGRAKQRARCTELVSENVVRACRWWYPERTADADDPFGVRATNINYCTDDQTGSCDPILGSWLLRGLPCRLRKVG